jgi:hypothetical protein
VKTRLLPRIRSARVITGILLLLTSGCRPGPATQSNAPRQETEAEFESRVWKLCEKLPEQTGNTDGYCERYNIDEHEPAKSLITIGPKCLPYLRKWCLDDMRKTKAWWNGRGSRYNLAVCDVVVCIMRHIGGEEERALLLRRREAYSEVWDRAVKYGNYHKKWSRDELGWYLNMARPARSGGSIMSWAIDAIDHRLKKEKKGK